MGILGHVDFVALKAEESSRMAHQSHGLIYSQFFEIHNIIELMGKGSEFVMNLMGCVATSLIGSRLLS